MITGDQEAVSEHQGGHSEELGEDWVSADLVEPQSSSALIAFRLFS